MQQDLTQGHTQSAVDACRVGPRFNTHEEANTVCEHVVTCMLSGSTDPVYACGPPTNEPLYTHDAVRRSNYGRVLRA